MHWWFGHVFINRNLPVLPQITPEKNQKASWLGTLARKSLTLLIKKIREKAELAHLRSQHRHLSDHLLQDIGYTRLEWEQLIAGKAVTRQPESATRQDQSIETIEQHDTSTNKMTNPSKPNKKVSCIFDNTEYCCTT
uniref:DUF1127 domain-containing protein n=1 Tax=uncultured Thiotrichaceae bacterium TaxID=298394 RepID=A0A6S6U6L8_9GAMM|nr:MAG: Unknown protein [uncultured Thiotrichaceae bacterium]